MSLITSNNGLKTTDTNAQEQLVDMMESIVIFNDKANLSVDKELIKTVQTFKDVMVKMEKNMTLLMEENILLKKQLIKLESDKTVNDVLQQQEKRASDERVNLLQEEVLSFKTRLSAFEDSFKGHTHTLDLTFSQHMDHYEAQNARVKFLRQHNYVLKSTGPDEVKK